MTESLRQIECALPLDQVNRAALREGQGQVSPLHLWWSRKPAAACRAALLGSLLAAGRDGPAAEHLALVARAAQAAPEDTEAWAAVRSAVAQAVGDDPPLVYDPFCGSGAIPAEAQRLGLPAVAADLNPVAVIAAKALLEVAPRFAERPPARPGPAPRGGGRLRGLLADLAYYGRRVRDEAERRIGAHYPPAAGMPVIAWLWARTAPCPNPACGRAMPLVHSLHLSRRPGREAWVVPTADGFLLGPAPGLSPPAEGTVNRRFASCPWCGARLPLGELRGLVRDQGFGQVLLAMVAAAGRGRRYLPADPSHEEAGRAPRAPWVPESELPGAALGFATAGYGLRRHQDLYTPRQRAALATFADVVRGLRGEVEGDARRAGFAPGGPGLAAGGDGAPAYADAVMTYLALALDRAAAKWCTFARWHRTRDNIEHPFASPGLHMLWDFAEANPFSAATGNWLDAVEAVAAALRRAPAQHAPVPAVRCLQADAAAGTGIRGAVVCTDPPYFDRLPYADMADLFYIWLRPVLRDVFPDLCAAPLTPKAEELVADPHRRGGNAAAREHVLAGLRRAFSHLAAAQDRRFPLTIFYACREGTAAGWGVVLAALLDAGLQVVATWPLRTEHAQRLRSRESNALASSILIVCRPRPDAAPVGTRREWVLALRRVLPDALRELAAQGLSPVDLPQVAIGRGMALFSRYAAVLDGGRPMDVEAALGAIAAEVEAALDGVTAGFDPPTRFCLAWCDLHGLEEGPFGEAEVLARAKGVALDALVRGGQVLAAAGRVRLAPPGAASGGDGSLWGTCQGLFTALEAGGAVAVGHRLAGSGWSAAEARALVSRLFASLQRRGDMAAARRCLSLAAALEPAMVTPAAVGTGEPGRPGTAAGTRRAGNGRGHRDAAT